MIEENISRNKQIEKLKKTSFDCLIIGGGATGAGTAHDAALRGLTVALVEKRDFSSATSSRSTKLIHGGVRYLSQFHFGLIREALHERKLLLENAPHLVKPLKFVLPGYKFYEKYYYAIGLTLYDFLAGDSGVPMHKMISQKEAIHHIPSIKQDKLKGGITYYDAQFNDSRLNVTIVRSAEKAGACVCNKTEVIGFLKEEGRINGVQVRDILTGEEFQVRAKIVVNAAGVFLDRVRKLDEKDCSPVLAPSQGIHLVFDRETIPCKTAMIIPKTADGRVVFIIPWENHVIMGTTDTAMEAVREEPLPIGNEVDFLLKTGNQYLEKRVTRQDIRSVFVGIRPLISEGTATETKKISREEAILVSDSGLITMGGGKWSTYRKMAQDLTDKIIKYGKLDEIRPCSTQDYNFPGKEGYSENMYLKISQQYGVEQQIAKRLRDFYGSEVYDILGEKPTELLKGIGYYQEEVLFFIRNEYALSLADVMARRFRLLFLDLLLTKKLMPSIMRVMAKELEWDKHRKQEEEKQLNDLLASLQKSIQPAQFSSATEGTTPPNA